MERFTDRKQLFGGCSIVLIERGEGDDLRIYNATPKE